jgi:hypothetical protein
LTAESAAPPIHFRCTRHSHHVTHIYNVSGDSLAPVRTHAMNARGLIATLTLGKFIGDKMPRIKELTLLPKLPLLISESADEFDALRDAFEREIKPRGIIEQMYVHDISSIVWEILRLRRCKVVIINSAFRSALEALLLQLISRPGEFGINLEFEAKALAHAWFTDQEAKKQVLEILNRFKLDEFSIEAEAIRRSCADLELLDQMLASLESRRNKALGCVAEYRASLAHQLRESADGIMDRKGVLRLEDEASERSTAA